MGVVTVDGSDAVFHCWKQSKLLQSSVSGKPLLGSPVSANEIPVFCPSHSHHQQTLLKQRLLGCSPSRGGN